MSWARVHAAPGGSDALQTVLRPRPGDSRQALGVRAARCAGLVLISSSETMRRTSLANRAVEIRVRGSRVRTGGSAASNTGSSFTGRPARRRTVTVGIVRTAGSPGAPDGSAHVPGSLRRPGVGGAWCPARAGQRPARGRESCVVARSFSCMRWCRPRGCGSGRGGRAGGGWCTRRAVTTATPASTTAR